MKQTLPPILGCFLLVSFSLSADSSSNTVAARETDAGIVNTAQAKAPELSLSPRAMENIFGLAELVSQVDEVSSSKLATPMRQATESLARGPCMIASIAEPLRETADQFGKLDGSHWANIDICSNFFSHMQESGQKARVLIDYMQTLCDVFTGGTGEEEHSKRETE